MANKVRHVLGISGGKDSAALAVYLKQQYPQLEIDYYFCDTGKELNETYDFIERLEVYLGTKITRLEAVPSSHEAPFDHFHKAYRGFLPSSNARWCTRKLKLEPFEKWVGEDPVVSYVAIRGDEDREGYISRKPNIQSIFPFRKNIWSEDVISKALRNQNIGRLLELYPKFAASRLSRIQEIVSRELSPEFNQDIKLAYLLSEDAIAFNHVVFEFLKSSNYALSLEAEYPVLDNDEVITREDVFRILENSGIGMPKYYQKIEFEVDGQKGEYARSRSGCFFCFFQQKIEWVWLYEQHPELFKKAMEYEKEGYSWNDDERLEQLIQPNRIAKIKNEQIKRSTNTRNSSPYLLDIIDDAEGIGCAACFI